MPAKLKPCPFCATTGRAVKHLADMGDHWVKCTFCNSTIGSCHSEEEAVAKWNKRAYINVENFNDLTTKVKSSADATATQIAKLYSELLLAVEQKCEGESRHDTALRIIRSSQSNSDCGRQLLLT